VGVSQDSLLGRRFDSLLGGASRVCGTKAIFTRCCACLGLVITRHLVLMMDRRLRV